MTWRSNVPVVMNRFTAGMPAANANVAAHYAERLTGNLHAVFSSTEATGKLAGSVEQQTVRAHAEERITRLEGRSPDTRAGRRALARGVAMRAQFQGIERDATLAGLALDSLGEMVFSRNFLAPIWEFGFRHATAKRFLRRPVWLITLVQESGEFARIAAQTMRAAVGP
jgi:hypothetical protein